MKNPIRAFFENDNQAERKFTFRITNWNQVLRDNLEAIEQVKRELVHKSVFPDRIDDSRQLFCVYTDDPHISANEVLEIIRRFGFDAEFRSTNDT